MDGKRKQNKIRKAGAAAAILGLAVLFFAFLAGFGRTAPDNPMEDGNADASRMYLTSSTLAMDEEQLANVENANISSGGAKGAAPEEEQKEEEQEEEEQQEQLQASQEEQQGQTQQIEADSQVTDTNVTANSPSIDSLLSLIQKQESGQTPGGGNQGGGGSGSGDDGQEGEGGGNQGGNGQTPSGGDSTTLDPDASALLFTTSLADGTVTESEYPFSISLTKAGEKLTLVSRTVTLNGMPKGCKEQDHVTLQEGANTISITLRFRDSSQGGSQRQVVASTREYTVYYVPESHYLLLVQNARTGEYLEKGGEMLVYENSFWIKVIAQKGSETIDEVQVRINNDKESADSDGIYRLPLKNGTNALRVTAGSGGNQQVFTYTVNYKRDDMALTFESAAITETVSGYQFGGNTTVDYQSESPAFAFRVSCSAPTGTEQITAVRVTTRYGSTDMKNMVGADGYIHFNLDASSVNAIRVQCLDGDGNTKSYTWNIKFKRVVSEEENQLHAPYIDVQLESETVHTSPFVMPLAAVDESGNKIAAVNMTVVCNGETLTYASQSAGGGYYEYNLYLTEGKNNVYIYVIDENGYWAEKNLTLTFSPEKDSATIHLIVSAEVVGLGNLIDEYVNVPAGYTVAQAVEERLAAYGYTTVHNSEPQYSDYYLAHIQKPGMLEGFSISDAEKEWLEMEGIGFTEEPSSMDSLGERDFTTISGWMVTQNYRDLGQSMGAFGIRDGDEIHVIYSLDMGNDVNLGA